MIETACPLCRSQLALRAPAMVLGRRLPDGDGTVTYLCTRCHCLVCVVLTLQEVMTAVFGGLRAIDVESVR